MKTIIPCALVFCLLMYVCIPAYSQTENKRNEKNIQPTKEHPVEIQKAKNHVYIELKKEKDEKGELKVVSKEVKRIEIPESFPKYIDTGNPKEDEANYYEAKQKWIKDHPDEYQKIRHLNL